jgi:hypothetical protein
MDITLIAVHGLVLSDHHQPNQAWINDGAGTFTDSGVRFGGGQFYRHVHLGDMDGDGDLDVFLPTFGMREGRHQIWFNQQRRARKTSTGSGWRAMRRLFYGRGCRSG